LIIDLEKEIAKKYKSKLVIITGDFFLSDPQISKEDKDSLYPQMIQAIKKVKDSIILVFSPTRLSNLMNYG
jgi:metallophosphoesterase superfamily enzyme